MQMNRGIQVSNALDGKEGIRHASPYSQTIERTSWDITFKHKLYCVQSGHRAIGRRRSREDSPRCGLDCDLNSGQRLDRLVCFPWNETDYDQPQQNLFTKVRLSKTRGLGFNMRGMSFKVHLGTTFLHREWLMSVTLCQMELSRMTVYRRVMS